MEFESRKSFNALCSQEDPVTLISYYPGEHSGRGRVKSTVVPPVIAKKSEKFFKTLRRRSKSASRLGDHPRKESNSSSSVVSSSSSILTYTANGERARNPDRIKKPDKVTLVGFSRSSLSDNEDGTSFSSSLASSRFSTLKTSREVKMERDRLRQERLSKLTQETKELIDKLKSEGSSIHRSLFNPNRERFFEEARERLQSGLSSGLGQPPSSAHTSSSNNDNDIISSFLREHQERFSTLLAQRRVASTFFTSSSSGCSNNNNISIVRKGGEEESKRSEGERKVKAVGVGERREQEHRAASAEEEEEEEEATTTVSNSSENDKQFSSSSSLDHQQQQQQQHSSPIVRHIPVIREFPNPLGENSTTSSSSSSSSSSSCNLHRSSSSSSSSGFSSIGRKSGLQGSRNNLSPHHHPSFENHFGFNRFGGGFRADFGVASNSFYPSLSSSPILSSGGKSSSSLNHNSNSNSSDKIKRNTSSKLLKINDSKIKSMDNSTSNFNRYSTSEEVTITSSFGDSEMESDEDEEEEDDEEEEEEEDLDSVSIVVSNSNGNEGSSGGPHNSSSATLRHHGVSNSRSKAPRPISAVPSEYSDVSTSSSRTSEGEDDVLVPSSNGEQGGSSIMESNGGDTNSNNSINNNNNNNNLNGVSNINHTSNSLKMESFGVVDNRLDKAHRIAKELLSTEEQYVRVLYLIDQVFHTRVDQENRTQNLFSPDVLPQMFANIKSIYKFHAEFLLPQLRERMENWKGSNQRIGDIFVKFSPFFKMYTEYVKNFGSAIHLINHLYNKNSKFAGIMDDIHSMPECGNLSLQHHMLTPIQRIPRYEMLLKDYLKKLPEDSDDREDSEKALHLVSTAAAHANDAMKRIEKFKKLLEVQECLSGTVDLVNPTRELVKEGKIVKISARSGDHQERYLFLFSDLLLLCSPRLITNRVIPSGTAPYRLRARFDVENIQILEGDNLVTANSFYIRDNHKSVELYTQTLEEKEDWLEALFQTIKELYQRKSSLRIGRETLKPLDCEIGRKQPHLLKLDTINKCMDCGHPFSMMRKKHNCRACGIVICAKCSGQKFPLSFEENKPCRVCRTCFNLLTSADFSSCDSSPTSSSSNSLTSGINPPTAKDAAAAAASSNGDSNSNLPSRAKGLLEVSPSESSVLCGYLQVKPLFNKGSSSKPLHRYFSLKYDGLLYSYISERDQRALTSTPLRNYGIYRGSLELKGDSNVPGDKDRTIKLVHEPGPCRNTSTSSTCSTTSSYSSSSSSSSNNRKIYYLFSNNLASAERWAEALKAASRGDFSLCSPPDKVSMGSSNDLHSSSSSHNIEGLE